MCVSHEAVVSSLMAAVDAHMVSKKAHIINYSFILIHNLDINYTRDSTK